MLLFLAFLTTFSFAQSQPLPPSVTAPKAIFIDNESGWTNVPSNVELALPASGMRRVKRREDSDLVFKFTRVAKPSEPTTNGKEINIVIQNILVLEVLDKSGTVVWMGSEVVTPPSADSKEARARYVLSFPAGKLVNRFSKELQK